MSVIDTLLSDIDQAVRGTGERRRHALLRRTTAALIDQLPDLSDHHLSIFDDVMVSLAGDVDTETRSELSEKLADLNRVPKKTMRRLALDQALRVAKPLIERSTCLEDETLITIIRDKDETFLRLVAKRRRLPPHILDHLVARADDALLTEIARNETMAISDSTLRLFAERALSDQSLYRILRTRPDLATRHIGAMIEAARHRARSDGTSRDHDDDDLSRALARETARSLAQSATLSLSWRSADAPDNPQLRIDLDDLLERHQIEDALQALAKQAGVKADAVKRAFHAPHHEPLMFFLRAQDYPLATVLHFLRHKHGTISHDYESRISDAYCALARDTAKRISAFMTAKHDPLSDSTEEPEHLRRSA